MPELILGVRCASHSEAATVPLWSHQSWKRPHAKLLTRLRENGHIAYFAGGCVRDMVRGLAPKDYDIATDARPEVVQETFSTDLRSWRAFWRDHRSGKRFSV